MARKLVVICIGKKSIKLWMRVICECFHSCMGYAWSNFAKKNMRLLAVRYHVAYMLISVQSSLRYWTSLCNNYNGHFFFVDSPYIHSCFNLTKMATHLSTMALFLVGSPYIHSCLNLSTMATSLQQLFFWWTVQTFTLVSTSLQQPFFWWTVQTFTLV